MQDRENFLDEYREEILKCTKCGFCRAVCPVFGITLRPAYNTKGKMLILKAVLDGSVEFDEELAEPFYICTACQACAINCPSNIKGNEIVEAARRELYDKGFTPEQLLAVRDNVSKSGNVFASEKEERIDIYPSDLREKAKKGALKDKAETLLFMGCLPSYLDMKTVPSFIKAMDAGKVVYTTLGTEESCCGFPIYLMGSDQFKPQAEKLIEKIATKGAHELVTPCAGCYKTFKKLYPEAGLDIGLEVYHTVQYIDKLIVDGKLNFIKELPKKITYHDPCDLGRACKIFEEPRNILKSIPGIELVEMERNRLDARCCGGGGGMTGFNPDLSVKMAAERVKDALAVGAEIIVSGCPACKDNLRKGARTIPKEERGKIKIMDITEIVTRALE